MRAGTPTRRSAANGFRARVMSFPFVESRAGDAEPPLHDGARGRILQELLFFRKQMVLDAKGRERRLVKARQDELLLAGVEVDVAHGEYPRETRLKPLRINEQRLLLKRKAPFGDGPELRMQPVENEEPIGAE